MIQDRTSTPRTSAMHQKDSISTPLQTSTRRHHPPTWLKATYRIKRMKHISKGLSNKITTSTTLTGSKIGDQEQEVRKSRT